MDPPFAISDEKQIIEIFEKTTSVCDAVDSIVAREFRVCNWGSCQYAYIQDACELLLRLQSIKGWTVSETLKFLENKTDTVNFDKLIAVRHPFQSARMAFLMNQHGLYADDEFMEDFDNLFQEVYQVTTIDGLFLLARNHAFDLWTAVDLFFSAIYPYEPSGEYGGNDTAYRCWILIANGLIKSDLCLRDFDT